MWLIRAIPVRKSVTNVISWSSGWKWALGAEGTVTVWSRWGSSSLRRYWRMTGKKPQREGVAAEYATVRVGRCSGYDRGQDIGPSVMISAVRCCDTSIIRGRCSPWQPHLPLGLRDFLSDGARTSGQRGHFGQPRRPEKPKQTSAREGVPRHLLPQRPLLNMSALVRRRLESPDP